MQSGNLAAMPPDRNEATFSFCQGSRSERTTTAILVSNCMIDPSFRGVAKRRTRNLMPITSRFRMRAHARCGMTGLPLRVAGTGPDHAFLAAELVAFAGRGVERGGNAGPYRIAVRTAGILHV